MWWPRHGTGHRLLPTEIPVKANIWALKKIGVERIISISAVGSLKEKIRPRDIVVPAQIIDRTKSRVNSFFGNGVVGHVSFAEPFCQQLSDIIYSKVAELNYSVHRGETYICMEGPQFSTRAESNIYRSWGVDIIGMTNLQEAKLAREAEICYATLACVTDYDCWHESEEDVSIAEVVENLKKNALNAQKIIRHTVKNVSPPRKCECAEAMKYAIVTHPEFIPEDVKTKLSPLIGKYLK